MTAIVNPYWDAVRDHVDPSGSLWNTPAVDGIGRYRTASGDLDIERWAREVPRRTDLVRQYAWTITDPYTVAFVAKHSRGRLVDPMAGTGYWAWVLTQAGVDVVAYDQHPPAPTSDANRYHRNVAAHCMVLSGDAAITAAHYPDRAMLLSWPPYGFDAVPILHAYRGDRVIYMGEDWGGCCGDDAMFEVFERNWVRVAEHVPVQWDGMHDVVHVYERRDGAS